MGFYQQNLNLRGNNIFGINPITWGDFEIVGFKEIYKKNDPISACLCRLKSQRWHDLILGILTNNINLVQENISQVDILSSIPVITNDPNKGTKFFNVKEAKKYSSPEIQDYIRKEYNYRALNRTSWFKQQTARNSRGSYFSTIPSFDGTQLAQIKPGSFKAFANPISVGGLQIIGMSDLFSNYGMPSQNIDYYSNLHLNLLYATISGDLNMAKNIIESAPDVKLICTMPTFVTSNYNELHIDLPFEAEQLGFTQLAKYLEDFEDFKENMIKSEELKSSIEQSTFVRADTEMEIED